ncbi:hypothetical protein E2C01_063982 [Portunus trituberculatus]|uniref:Uncharacterized protein n=1 Tax=Portunus trituberculatus TaxID=210409 RepID=A0A5B7HAK3_PORTR|nr:hypothetical protein [Portunus trituberculatus]
MSILCVPLHLQVSYESRVVVVTGQIILIFECHAANEVREQSTVIHLPEWLLPPKVLEDVKNLRGHFHCLSATVHLLRGSLKKTEDDSDPLSEFAVASDPRLLPWRWLDACGLLEMPCRCDVASVKSALVFSRRGEIGSVAGLLLRPQTLF